MSIVPTVPAYKVAPRVLSELGADLVPIGCSPNGRNINANCGSTHPELLQATVTGVGADLGIALDGDGDRLLMVDHEGNLIDGDQLLYLVANARHKDGNLQGPVVGTLMSNLGLEKSLQRARYRIYAGQCRRSLRAGNAQGAQWDSGR